MMDSTDMSTPVTRGELQEALSQVKQEHWRDLREAIAPLATRAEFHQEIQTAIAPLATRAELHQVQHELQTTIASLATRAELHQVQQELQTTIASVATRAELHRVQQELQTTIASLATRTELEMWGGALVARIQHGEQRLSNLERGQDQLIGLVQQTQQQIQQTEQRLLAELARHTSAVHEAMRTQIKAGTEPFDDLPGRVSRLETEVFGPAPRNRRTRRRSH
jgi:plasmid stabilization system protein ParE